ncbi:MAG: DNA polymerase III subunit gamma/tau [Atribacterota bacterium]|nr:DNA polymerase III subunit gamma/tau [Atribacterota bacterium]MDD4895606.1 DNA polymerase III subunit gamma/tau [Atribacterota bacterium]MDD5637262.1 DNA polymerase III subunit gamma/tau [Atribacterota bacterium]
MAQYQSIYRKWRPQSFEDVVGQNHITQTLRNAIKLDRISHAYLFSGPRGVGKTTTARILAKALNCQNGPTEHPCNQCSCCIRINKGQSMDVLEIDGASNRGIEEIRELRSKIGFAPAEGRYKIYIIDEVHMLTNEAFNALLKTLEEPPSQVLFIFATTASHKVPKTILSRCQCFYFHRISIEEMVEKLKRIAEEEKLNIDLSSLRLIAESATGSMRDAESILDQVITYSENKVTPEEVRDILGFMPREIFWQLIEAIINHNTEIGLKLINKLVREGVELNQFVQDLLIYTHNVSLLKVLGKDNPYSHLYLESSELNKIWVLLVNTDIKTIFDIIEELKIIEERIRFHHYPWVLLELMIVKLTHAKDKSTQQESLAADIISKSVTVKKVEKIQPAIEKDKNEYPSKDKVTTNMKNQKKYELEKLWPKVLSRIKKEKISLYAFLMAGNSIGIEDDQLIVSFSADCLFHKESLEKKENKEKVETILKEESNCEIKLKCIIEENKSKEDKRFALERNKGKIKDNHSLVKPVVGEKKKNDSNKEENLTENDILKRARDLFGGEISKE